MAVPPVCTFRKILFFLQNLRTVDTQLRSLSARLTRRTIRGEHAARKVMRNAEWQACAIRAGMTNGFKRSHKLGGSGEHERENIGITGLAEAAAAALS
jgi:hypothetical protein